MEDRDMTGSQDPYTPPPAAPGPAPAAWGTPPPPRPYGTAYPQPRNGLGTAALVLGILALPAAFTVLGGIVFGIVAIVLGVLARGRAKRHEASNGGAATAGAVLGALGIAAAVAFGAFLLSVLNSNNGRELLDCLERATSSSQAQQCRTEFERGYRG
jgi:hypothetical protein